MLAYSRNGSIRSCIDYRRLQTVIVRTLWPQIRMDDCNDSLKEAKFSFTTNACFGCCLAPLNKCNLVYTARAFY